LALAAVERLAGRFRDGAGVVLVADVRDPQLLAASMLTALAVRADGALLSIEQIVPWLAEREHDAGSLASAIPAPSTALVPGRSWPPPSLNASPGRSTLRPAATAGLESSVPVDPIKHAPVRTPPQVLKMQVKVHPRLHPVIPRAVTPIRDSSD
jgi:hypothetical protein